ncbi:hypothetical protein GS682_31975 [Nostoc sp. B(2019)]|nr:hypothetical protein [Nostoc sp. B(2019)]
MNLQDFESQYREAMSEMLNELQTTALLLAQLQLKISQIGSSVQNMSETVENFIAEKQVE